MRRRTFLSVAGGGLVAAIAVGSQVPIPAIPGRPEPTLEGAAGWIRYRRGRFELLLPRAEIGQNAATAFKQIACAELGAEWEDVEVILPDTAQIEPVRATVGSESIQAFAVPLAQACAALRDAVAAGRAEGDVMVEERAVGSLRAFQFGAMARIAKPQIEQGQAIVTGQPLYAADVRLEGMVYGRVLRAPAGPDIASRPIRWRADAAEAAPGFLALVTGERLDRRAAEGVGLVAKTPGALDRIEEALSVEWEIDGDASGDFAERVDVDRQEALGGPRYMLADDPVEVEGAWDVDLRLDTPLGAHSAIEPRAAVAEPTADGVKIWAGTQDAFFVRDATAKMLGLDRDAVLVQPMRVGGAFGGKTLCTVELEAAALALAVGRPVKVQWTRAQELRQSHHRPPSSHRIRARLKKDGAIEDWEHRFVTGHILFTNAVVPPWLQTITNMTTDKGAARGALPPYRMARRKVGMDLERLPVFSGPWRGLGAGPNTLAIECAMDECARRSGEDPLAYRLRHIDDPRLAATLGEVAEIADWKGEAARRVGGARKGRGVACGIYKGASYAAVVADVAVAADGAVSVERMFCAHECGLVINADQVRAQCEGNMIWGLGLVMDDALEVQGGQVAAEGFSDAPVPSIAQAPEMTVALVDSDAPPTGAGETAIVAAPGAILNAVRAATGVRAQRLPLRAAALAE